jgi:Sulfotransferase family
VAGDDTELTCHTFYAKRFWDAAPQHLVDGLQWQRDHRPKNCWYETEILIYHKVEEAKQTPYKEAVCEGPFPDSVVFWHNFKVAGTTARVNFGGTRFPNYASGEHVFSNRLRALFPDAEPKENGANYLMHADIIKQQIHEDQMRNGDKSVSFTFVRSPVQRFLSGLEQIERLNNVVWEVSPEAAPCFSIEDSLVKLECIVDRILETRVFFNVHIYPQAYLFDTWTKKGEYDLAVIVLDLKEMDPLFKRFKGKTGKRERQSTEKNTKLRLVDKDLEPNLLRKICKLYEVDLLMLKAMNMLDELCASVLQV